jgi:hypothetical protein
MNLLLLHSGVRLHGLWGPDQVGRIVEVSWGFHDLLTCSGVFLTPWWMMLKKVLGDVAS